MLSACRYSRTDDGAIDATRREQGVCPTKPRRLVTTKRVFQTTKGILNLALYDLCGTDYPIPVHGMLLSKHVAHRITTFQSCVSIGMQNCISQAVRMHMIKFAGCHTPNAEALGVVADGKRRCQVRSCAAPGKRGGAWRSTCQSGAGPHRAFCGQNSNGNTIGTSRGGRRDESSPFGAKPTMAGWRLHRSS